MKAEFKRTKTADGLPLTPGKMYGVLDYKAGRRAYRVKEIRIKNDLGEEQWYSANKFKLFAEASAFLKEPGAAGAGQDAAQSVTPDGSQMVKAEIEKRIAAQLAGTTGLQYGA